MDYERSLPILRPPVNHYTDMRSIKGKHPANDITCKIMIGIIRNSEFHTLPLEECVQIRHPSVINISIRSGEPPQLGVR
jgi:hypothetical protein